MRLTCPNCGAQYEVSAEAIPDAGRDVQCSNCGHTWFQTPQAQTPETLDQEVQGVYHGEEDEVPVETQVSADDAYGFEDVEPQAPQRQPLPDDVSKILRQEAEYEAKRRAEEASALESQPDLGIDNTGDQREQEAQARLSRLRGNPQEEAIAAAVAASRKDLLPDIEEINSSLRSSSDRGTDDVQADQPADVERKRKSGFRFGFIFILALAAICLAIYVFAPEFAAQFPDLAAPLQSYVDLVNDLRLWLNNLAQAAMTKVTKLINR